MTENSSLNTSDKKKSNIIKVSTTLKNSREAIAFGENASYEDMLKLMKDCMSSLTQTVINASVDLQILSEAHHAFTKDEWYQLNVVRHRTNIEPPQ